MNSQVISPEGERTVEIDPHLGKAQLTGNLRWIHAVEGKQLTGELGEVAVQGTSVWWLTI